MIEEERPKRRMTQEHWLSLYNEWKQSGESQAVFCRSKEINYHTFVYWRNKHNTKLKSQNKLSFAKARLSAPISASTNSIRMILTNGVQVIIPPDCDRIILSDLFKMIGIAAC